MKVLVTGGAGYIGSHTCKELVQNNHEVAVYDNLSTGHRKFVKWGQFIYGDILDTQKLRANLKKFKPDVVIHFAACAYVGESVTNPGKYFENNVRGTLSLLESMRDEGINNIVVSSTCAVYGQPKNIPITEDTLCLPINPYGASKLFMEQMLLAFQRAHEINWISLRYFNAAGGSSKGEIGELHSPETHLIPRVILAALRIIPPVKIFGTNYNTYDGTCIRDYIHVEDLASAHVLAAQHLLNNSAKGVFNLGTGKGNSVLEIIKLTNMISQKIVPYHEFSPREGDPAILIADPSKAKEILKWSSKKEIGSIIEDAWHFLSHNKDFFNESYT